jgi:hypothetical protein
LIIAKMRKTFGIAHLIGKYPFRTKIDHFPIYGTLQEDDSGSVAPNRKLHPLTGLSGIAA